MTLWTFVLAVETVVEAGAEAAESSGGLFNFDATLPIMAAQFLLMVAILNAIFFKPLTKAIDDRSDYVRGNIAEAKERLGKAQALAQQYEQELSATRRQVKDRLQSAQVDANKIRNQRIAEAMAESQAQVATAKAEIAQQKQAASDSLNTQTATLSRQILEKLLGDLVRS